MGKKQKSELTKKEASVLIHIAQSPTAKQEDIARNIPYDSIGQTIHNLRERALIVTDPTIGWFERPLGDRMDIGKSDKTYFFAVTGKGKRLLRQEFRDRLEFIMELEQGINGLHYVPDHAREHAGGDEQWPTDPDTFPYKMGEVKTPNIKYMFVAGIARPRADEKPEDFNKRVISTIIHDADFEEQKNELLEFGDSDRLSVRVLSKYGDDKDAPPLLVGWFSMGVTKDEAMHIYHDVRPEDEEYWPNA